MTIHFDSSILKIRKDGARVISVTLERGEKLADGRTYSEVKKGDKPTPEVEGGGLTLDMETNSSVPIENDAKVSGPQTHADDLGQSSTAGDTALTLDETKTSTVSSDADKGSDDDSDDVPAKSASKADWFAYAQSQGFDGDEDDVTKAELVEKYGA